ncbi:hypothetical protein LWI29_004099 [Acer saccharum]|uniref:Uncharacterized protein n=1 Tax=Acer saccharum TaxID=4024 RepID=A0AA39SQL0_ACESA|nr:hypothetical protein LWI29_004099 [Acer saccharum]
MIGVYAPVQHNPATSSTVTSTISRRSMSTSSYLPSSGRSMSTSTYRPTPGLCRPPHIDQLHVGRCRPPHIDQLQLGLCRPPHIDQLQVKVAAVVISVLLMFCITAAISAFVFHDHHNRKVFVGSVGLVACVAMYGSPLVVVSPNIAATPLGLLQLVLYCKYKKSRDIEQNEEKSKQLQLVTNFHTN